MGNVLTTFVKKECSNWDMNNCIGTTILSTGLFNTNGKCYILQGKPCTFFEKYVLPSAKNEANYDKILKYYSKINPKFDPAELNTCNECGKTIPPRKRYCKECAKKLRRKTYKKSSRNYRYGCQHLSNIMFLYILAISAFTRCHFSVVWGKAIITLFSCFFKVKC